MSSNEGRGQERARERRGTKAGVLSSPGDNGRIHRGDGRSVSRARSSHGSAAPSVADSVRF